MRILKIVPILHTLGELSGFPVDLSCLPVDEERMNKIWSILAKAIRGCYYDGWKGVQIFVDGFAIPVRFRDPDMTPRKYKEEWFRRMEEVDSPLGRIVRGLCDRGAILESTEIQDRDFWIRYKATLKEIIERKATMAELDRLDETRNERIVSNINKTLKERGLLLIGRSHIEGLRRQTWDSDIKIRYL